MTREKWIERLASAADLIRAGVVMDQHIHLSAGEADQIVELLKDGTPMPVKVIKTDYGIQYVCAACSTLLVFNRKPMTVEQLGTIKRFCHYCGRKIDWRGAE